MPSSPLNLITATRYYMVFRYFYSTDYKTPLHDLTRTRKHNHITPILQKLHWLPVRQRIIFKLLLLTYKALHGLAPGYITDMLQLHKPTRELRSSTRLLLKIPPARLARYGEPAFQHASPSLWNSLSEEIRRCDTVT